MDDDKRALFKRRLESGELRLQPLTFPQRELWETSPVAVEDHAHHICCLIEVRGAITPEQGGGALRLVVDRQEALRLSFLPGRAAPLQLIRREGVLNFRFRELSERERDPVAVERIAREIADAPFDLLQGPLYRVELLRRGADDHVLVFAIHHAIGDGWTLGLFVQELCLAFLQRARGAGEGLPPLPQSYSAWGAAERAFWQPQELEPRVSFWKAHLAGYRRLWEAREGPATAAGPHQRVVAHFPAALAAAARNLARHSGATLFTTLLTAFQMAFARWAGVDDVLVGAPVANRSKQITRETMGYYAGIVPLRARIEAQRTFAESLRATHLATMECFAQAMPFAELARALGDTGKPGHNPIFEVRFALQNHPIPDVALAGLSATLRTRSTGTARFHLACEVTEEVDGLEVVWLFRPQLFPEADVAKLGHLFQLVLTRAGEMPERRFAELTSPP